MASFTDTQGRSWLIEVNVGSARQVKKLLGVDILQLLGEQMKPLADLLSNPMQFVDVLYALCQEEAEERGVSDMDFGRSLAGDALEQAADAFVEALVDFFPKSQRGQIRTAFQKGKAAVNLMMAQVDRELAQIRPEDLLEQFGGPFGTAPASLESTPDRSPSAN